MSEQELAAAGELGTSATLVVVFWAFAIEHTRRLHVPYMFLTILRNLGRTRDGCGHGLTRPSDRRTWDHETVKDVWPHILS